jgi:hypothetical protein
MLMDVNGMLMGYGNVNRMLMACYDNMATTPMVNSG